jgi:hypothetical protein
MYRFEAVYSSTTQQIILLIGLFSLFFISFIAEKLKDITE